MVEHDEPPLLGGQQAGLVERVLVPIYGWGLALAGCLVGGWAIKYLFNYVSASFLLFSYSVRTGLYLGYVVAMLLHSALTLFSPLLMVAAAFRITSLVRAGSGFWSWRLRDRVLIPLLPFILVNLVFSALASFLGTGKYWAIH